MLTLTRSESANSDLHGKGRDNGRNEDENVDRDRDWDEDILVIDSQSRGGPMAKPESKPTSLAPASETIFLQAMSSSTTQSVMPNSILPVSR